MEVVSILIPTRNRPQLARLAVEAALEAADAETEVVVADNSDAVLALPQDPRLRHLRPEGVLSMPDNWERALRAARGHWVILLADKYMLVPGGLELLRRMMGDSRAVISYGLGQLRQGLPPDQEDDYERLRKAGGQLIWPAAQSCDERDARQDLRRLVASANYPRNYPMLYTAAVRRDLLLAAAERTGRFFLGSCPDVASALQILGAARQWTATQIPLVLAQYPSASTRWSMGSSTLAGGALSRGFFRELGVPTPLVEQTVAGAVFATMRAFASSRADLDLPVEEGFVSFARLMSWEIEGLPPSRRIPTHKALLAYTQDGGLRFGAAGAQLRAALAMCVPRKLRQALAARRPPPQAGPEAPQPAIACDVVSRQEALERLSARLRETA